MKISKLIKGLEMFKDHHGDINVEALHNVLGDEHRQHDNVTGVTMIEADKKKSLIITTGGGNNE